MNTGEHEQGLKKVIDLIRMIALVILFFHFYFYCYRAFEAWHLTSKILLNGFVKSELIALVLLMLSIPGVKGRKKEREAAMQHCICLVICRILFNHDNCKNKSVA